jgi:hypothetical protein
MPHHSGLAQDVSPNASDASVLGRFESDDSPVSVVAQIMPTKAQVAVPMQYRVTIDAPPGATVVLPPIAGVSINETDKLSIVDQPFADYLLTGVEVIRDLPMNTNSGTRRTQLILEIESLKSGLRRTPALEVVYRLVDAKTATPGFDSEGTVRIPPLGLDIGSVLVAEDSPDKFRDIKNALATPVKSSDKSSPVMGLLFVGAGACFVGLLWWSRRAKCFKPEQWALQRVAELQNAYESNAISTAEVYGDLSLVLRDYVQSAYSTPATALCTAEFLDRLRCAGFEAEVISGARAILSKADVSKFAAAAGPLEEGGISPFEQAKAVVENSVRLKKLVQQRTAGAESTAVGSTMEAARKVEA